MKKTLLALMSIITFTSVAQDSLDCELALNFSYEIEDDTIYFTNTSTGETPSSTYTWLVNGILSHEENPSFSTVGFDSEELVCFAVTDSLGECSDSLCTVITITDEDSCDITASFTYTIADGVINFINTSTGTDPSTYTWLVNGILSHEENPSFSTVGFDSEELVCFAVTDSLGECSDSLCTVITITDEDSCDITASFTYTIADGVINFTNTSTGTDPSTYTWLVNGILSHEENPSFSTVGFDSEELVCFAVTDSLGECSDSLCTVITITDEDSCDITASFTYTIADGMINFINTSTGTDPSTSYNWHIDGLFSSDENPSFSTAEFEATEAVCLYVYDDSTACADSLCTLIYFEEDSCDITASFTYTIADGMVNFTNTSTGTDPSTSYNWHIDGLFSSDENPSFSTAGFEATEIVCLYVFDDSTACADSLCTLIYFEEDSCDITASFTYTQVGTTMNFNNTSYTTGSTEYKWYIDGVLTSTAENPTLSVEELGYYSYVCLEIYDTLYSCYDSICKHVYTDSTIIDSTASLSNYSSLDFSIYPNPAHDVLFISASGKNQVVVIYNSIGKVVKEEELNIEDDKLQLNIEALTDGVYIIHLIDKERNITYPPKRFIKK